MFDENEKYIRVIVSVEEDDVAHADAPYAIELTDKMDSAALEYIKKLLMANRGSRKVVINIDSNGKKAIHSRAVRSGSKSGTKKTDC